MNYLPKNPLSSVGNFKDPYDVNKTDKLHYYTPKEFKKFIACARKHAYEIPAYQTQIYVMPNRPDLNPYESTILDILTRLYWQMRASIFKKSPDGSDTPK